MGGSWGGRDQEGRRGSEDVVPRPSVFPSRESGLSGTFWQKLDQGLSAT